MDIAILWRWLSNKPRQRPDLRFLFYTRANCPLCDEARELLERYQHAHGFHLAFTDVDSNLELISAYGKCVPVVLVNGKVRFRGKVNEVLLQRILND